MHLRGPKLVAGWVDVTDRVFECCEEGSGYVIDRRIVRCLVRVIRSKNSVKQTQNDNPNEHESGKVDHISASRAHQLDQEAKVSVNFEVFKQFEGDAHAQRAVGEQEEAIDRIDVASGLRKKVLRIEDSHHGISSVKYELEHVVLIVELI